MGADPSYTRDDWLGLVREEIVDSGQPIVDPHHHLWHSRAGDYLAEHLVADIRSGHDVRKTVFVECHSAYGQDGPPHLRPIGETELVVEQAKRTIELGGPEIAGIVATTADSTRACSPRCSTRTRPRAPASSAGSGTRGPTLRISTA